MKRVAFCVALAYALSGHAADAVPGVAPLSPGLAIGSIGTGVGAPVTGSGLPSSMIGSVGGPLERSPIGSAGPTQPTRDNPVTGVCTSHPPDLRQCDSLDTSRRDAGPPPAK